MGERQSETRKELEREGRIGGGGRQMAEMLRETGM